MSIKLFDIKVAPAKLRFECFFHHRWEERVTAIDRLHTWRQGHYAFELGVNRYEGLQVRGTNVCPINWIFYLRLMPVFQLMLDVTWRYKQELRLEIDDNE